MKKKLPHFDFEKQLWKKGYTVIGIDEVGRGAFAGPLVMSGVVFKSIQRKKEIQYLLSFGINDSKQLSATKREKLSKIIKKECLCAVSVSIPVSVINRVGIGKSTSIAVRKIVSKIRKKHSNRKHYLLIDAFSIKYVRGVGLKNQKGIIKGDCISLSIAAASIIAKVKRDTYMKKISKKYPEYGFEKHMGYGTLRHRTAIKKFGKLSIHRDAFIRKLTRDDSK